MLNSAEALRRWCGMFSLAVAAAMMIWGRTYLWPHLSGTLFRIYWAACFLFAIAAVVLAAVDIWFIWRTLRQGRATRARRTLENIRRDTPDSTSASDSNARS